MSIVKTYYALAKPGIVYGNLLAAAAGFLLASKGQVDFWLLLAALAGIAFVIGSACVFNNYIDRDIDRHMARTKKRALVTGEISARGALVYATILGVAGVAILARFTNALTVWAGLLGVFFYVVLYGVAKRRSVYGTHVGSVAGAIPLVAGYTAVTNRLDGGAVLLFLVLALWQMPHFFAIALYRQKEYASAKLPVWPVQKGAVSTQLQILIYVMLFTFAASLLTVFGYTGYTYLAVMVLVGLYWLRLGLRGLRTKDHVQWGRTMFFFSLKVLLVFCGMISIDFLLP